jgi:tripartite-type tricarboxylate transporter receptor subunit TctC
LLYGGLASIAAAPHLLARLRYDPRRDLAPVHGIGASPNFMTVSASCPWATLQDFVAFARAAPSGPIYASPGIGTSSHLSGAILQHVAGTRLRHAPYANASLALADVAGGRVDAIWEAPLIALPHIQAQRLRALAVTGQRRVPAAPDVPTVAEAGFAGAEMRSWSGIFVPARTPPDRVVRLADALREALRDPEVERSFGDAGVELWPDMHQARFTAFLSAELPRIEALIGRFGTAVD